MRTTATIEFEVVHPERAIITFHWAPEAENLRSSTILSMSPRELSALKRMHPCVDVLDTNSRLLGVIDGLIERGLVVDARPVDDGSSTEQNLDAIWATTKRSRLTLGVVVKPRSGHPGAALGATVTTLGKAVLTAMSENRAALVAEALQTPLESVGVGEA